MGTTFIASSSPFGRYLSTKASLIFEPESRSIAFTASYCLMRSSGTLALINSFLSIESIAASIRAFSSATVALETPESYGWESGRSYSSPNIPARRSPTKPLSVILSKAGCNSCGPNISNSSEAFAPEGTSRPRLGY